MFARAVMFGGFMLMFLLTTALTEFQRQNSTSQWAWPHRGDVRAVVSVPPQISGAPVAVEITWRRHDRNPDTKRVIVTDLNDIELPSWAPIITQHVGVVVFTPLVSATNSTYYVYYLPYTQSGIGHITFSWDEPDEAGNWTDIGSWKVVSGTSAPQVFLLPAPVTGTRFRWQCDQTTKHFQPFIREIRIRNSTEWVGNQASAVNPSPVFDSSGWRPGGDPLTGESWCAMDGNITTIWDATTEFAWLDLQFTTPLNMSAVELTAYGDTVHDATLMRMQVMKIPNPHPNWTTYPKIPAQNVHLQARTPFESFDPMELAANETETEEIVKNFNTSSFVVFPEHREFPVRMVDKIPSRWLGQSHDKFSATVLRGEHFTFQLAVFVPNTQDSLVNVTAEISGLSPLSVTCYNLEGVDSTGLSFTKSISVSPGRVQPLWFGATIPENLAAGSKIAGSVAIGSTLTSPTATVQIILSVSDAPGSVNAGDNIPSLYTRLRWLNSDLAMDTEVVTPYTAITSQKEHASCDTVSILNRDVILGTLGFPVAVNVTTPATMHGALPSRTTPILDDGGIHLEVYLTENQPPLNFTAHGCPVVNLTGPGRAMWSAVSTVTVGTLSLTANVTMTLSFEGYMDAQIDLTASIPTNVSDIRLITPIRAADGLIRMGMDMEALPVSTGAPIMWRWGAPSKMSSAVWVGSPSAGVRLHLKGSGPFWDSPAPNPDLIDPPTEWGAVSGAGGCNVTARATGGACLTAFTGQQLLSQTPVSLHYDMTITPFKTANQTEHWGLRHFQVGYPTSQFTSAKDVKKTGATVVNIHQGVQTMINPYINYPFVPESVALLENYTEEANQLGMRVKFYYTVRELSNHAAEIWALRSLGDEVYQRPPCGYNDFPDCAGTAWQRLHLGNNYSEAWVCPLSDGEFDAAIAQQGLAGRWLNYYIEGLKYSVTNNPHINGIYYDGILFDRSTMMRVRKVLDRYSSPSYPGLIDFHTGNDYTIRHITDAVTYMNHWAFVDALWIGEGFSYDSLPIYWLAQISGLPFGVFSDMLGSASHINQYRGMLFGSTGRFGDSDPTPMWQFWDQVAIHETDMIGWWDSAVPVRLSNSTNPFVEEQETVLATSYVAPGRRTIIAIASWAPNVRNVTLLVNWTALDLDPTSVTMSAPAIDGFQPAFSWSSPLDSFTVSPGVSMQSDEIHA